MPDTQIFDDPQNENFILRCRVGSQAYGTSTPESDEDFKGVYIPPIFQLLGVQAEKQTIRYSADDQSYSLRHYAKLCVQCQPNVLELLFCEDEDVISSTSEGRKLRRNRDLFLSKNCVARYLGYAESQLRKSNKAPQGRGIGRTSLIEEFGYDTKFASHTIRLLQTVDDILRTGVLLVRRPNAEFLKDIRNGKAFKDYYAFASFAKKLAESIREIEEKSGLREKPDLEAINNLLVELHRSALNI